MTGIIMAPMRNPTSFCAPLLVFALGLLPAGAAAGDTTAPPTERIEDLWRRGEASWNDGNLPAAREAFAAALALDERRARSWNYVGGVRYAGGEWAAALEAFRRAFELDPHDARAANNAGTACDRLGDYAGAERYYLAAAAADPLYAASQRNLGILYARRLNRPADARRAWRRYLALQPAGPEADEVRHELMSLPSAGAALPSPPQEAPASAAPPSH
jgi:tetratricopeptide (TPR) repeat protein